jgi:hypothetical protein
MVTIIGEVGNKVQISQLIKLFLQLIKIDMSYSFIILFIYSIT